MPRKTPLYDNHVKRGAKAVDFAGWFLPVQFSSIIEEHNATRRSSGIFDIGHMGQIETNDIEAIEYLTTNSVKKLTDGSGQYSFICEDDGGIIDDLIVYRLSDKVLIVSNAVNALSVFEKFKAKAKDARKLYDEMTAIALQGPESIRIMQKLLKQDVSQMKHRQIAETKFSSFKCLVSRSGYSGEDGFEIFIEEKGAEPLWEALIKEGSTPCGLGARDTLRIEAGLPLYGHEINLDISPVEAGYSKAIDFSKADFAGRQALFDQSKNGRTKKLIGFEVLDRAIPRQGYKIFCDDKEAGSVTSGTFSPTLNKPIGMGYIESQLPVAGGQAVDSGQWTVEIRDKKYPIKIVKLPFYRRCGKI